MKNLLAVLVIAILMVLPVIFVGGCQQSSDVNGRVAATPAANPSDSANQDQDNDNGSDNANQDQDNDNGSEWYGEAGSDR